VSGLALPPDPTRYGQALLLIRTTSLESDSTGLMRWQKADSLLVLARKGRDLAD